MKTIMKTKKVFSIHPATVRATLKRNGFDVGRWSKNGRIAGMSNWFGDIEVKENWLNLEVETLKLSDNLWKRTTTNFSNVKVRIWNDSVDIKKVAKVLKEEGLKVEIDEDEIIVEKK